MDLNYARYVDKWVGLPICLLLFAWERTLGRLHGRRVPSLRATTPPGEEPLPAPRRVLAMKFYGLGNMVMLLPVLEALRRRFPEAEIDFLTLAGNTDLLERSGVVNRALALDIGGGRRFLGSVFRALRELRRRDYDTVVDFEQFVKISSIIGFLSGARQRIGFNTDSQRRGFMYTTRIVYTDSDHITEIFARLLRPWRIVGELPAMQLSLREEERLRVRRLLEGGGVAAEQFPLVVVHPGMGGNFYRIPVKRWDPENFAAVARGLVERHQARIVFTGKGAEEAELIRGLQAAMPAGSAIDACDQLDVGELAALLDRCDFVVCNDTSVMHLATLVDTPVVALFGPTAPLHYGPRGAGRDLVLYRDLYCSPCLTNYNLKVSRCADPACMRGIRSEQVLAAIGKHFLEKGATHRDWILGRARRAVSAA